MTATNYSNITSAPYDVVFSVINTRANVADPRDVTGARKFVWDAEPFTKAMDFSAYPLIIIKMPTLEQTQKTVDNFRKRLAYSQTLIVRTVKLGSGGSRSDAGHSDMQAILDALVTTFNKSSVLSTLRNNGLFSVKLDIINSDDLSLESQQVLYETELELTYETPLRTVS